MTCLEVIACISRSQFSSMLDAAFLCEFMKCNTSCATALCSFNGLPSSGQTKCDINGDGNIDCEDLRLMIELLKACRCAGNLAPPTPAEIAALACQFYGTGGCFRAGEGSISGNSVVKCAEIAACIQSISDIPASAYCAIMAGACPGVTTPPGCTSVACSAFNVLDEPPTAIDSAICDEISQYGLEAVLRVMRCCPEADGLSAQEWAAVLCALKAQCGLTCKQIADALEKVFDFDTASEILSYVLDCASCEEFESDLLQEAQRKRGLRCGTAGGRTMSSDPVEFFTGEKLEFTTDFSVALPGGSFSLTRSYSSEAALSYAQTKSVFGAAWSMPIGQWIKPDAAPSSATTLQLHNETANEYREFVKDVGTGLFVSDKPDHAFIELVEGTVVLDGGGVDEAMLWRLHTPGEGVREYIAGLDTTGPDVTDSGANASFVSDRVGHMVREASIHGRRHEYTYKNYGGSGTALRPHIIYLAMFNGETRSAARARLVFNWNLSGTGTKGRLRRIDVFRPQSGADLLTDQVEYAYLESGGSSELGAPGDLIQVTAREITDSVDETGAPIYRTRVTQYRYHAGSGTGNNLLPSTVVGAAHQLKAVFEPEQIEYFAQRYFEASPSANKADTVEEAAQVLLAAGDDTVVLSTSSETRKALDFAAKVVGYYPASIPAADSDNRVAVQFLQASCGCGGAAQGVRQTYEYIVNSDDVTAILREHTEDTVSGGYSPAAFRVTRHDVKLLDGTPYLLSKAVSAAVASNDGTAWWVWGYKHDSSQRLTHEFMPSAINVYTKAAGTTPASFTVKTSAGLVNFYAYNSDDRVTERRSGSGATTTATDFTLVEKTTYYSGGSALTSYLPSKIERYRWPGSTSAAHVETIDYSYGFRTAPDLAWVKVSHEAEATTENGPGGSYHTYQLINDRGQTDWSRAEDYALRSFTYDNLTGAVLTLTTNADPTGITTSSYGSGAPSITGWGNAGGGSTRLAGGTLTTTYTIDALGRTTSAARPAGSGTPVTTRIVRQMLVNPARQGVLYYATVDLPHKWTDTSGDQYAGPASVSWENASGSDIASADFEVTFSTATPGSYTLGTQLSKSTVDHALTGLTLATRRWRSVADNLYDSSTLTYDLRGNVDTKTTPNGTIEQYTYDLLDRPIAVSVGTNPATSGGNMKTVVESFYDYDAASSGTPTQGIGDGNVTLVRQYFGDGSGDYRDSVRIYDHRNRLVQVRGKRDSLGTSVGPHEVRAYDNLDRIVERALYTAIGTLSGTQGEDHADEISNDASSRTVYSRIYYSQRGRAFMSSAVTAPTLSLNSNLQTRNTTALSSALSRATWYDGTGRTVTQASPNGAYAKQEYDGHGRVVRSFATDRDGATVSSHSTSGDQVLEQTNFVYDDRDRLSHTTQYLRRHDDTTTRGPLDAGGVVAVKMFAGAVYDGADRMVKNVNLGTNVSGNTTLTAGGSAPGTWPPSSLPSYPDAITDTMSYNARGSVAWKQDALGRKTAFKYDDLDRQVAVIENSTLDPDADITWDGSLDRWEVDGAVLSSSAPDTNRVTSTVFDASGNTVKLVAHKPVPGGGSGEAVQITEYVYGVTAGSASTAMDSLLYSNDMLLEVRYPQESGGSAGQPGTTDAFKVKYAYNRLGELRASTDQNGTRHEYTRDTAGRVTLDSVGAFGTDIDQAVKSIAVTYDTAGRMREVISSSDTTGTTPVNGVAFTYTALWQPSLLRQNHTGAALTSGGSSATGTKSLAYSYLTAPYTAGSASNFSRLYEMSYPDNSTVVSHWYSGIDGRVSRTSAIRMTSAGVSLTEIANYKRVGMGMTAVVDFPNPDVQLDYTFSHSDRKRSAVGWTSQTSGTYPGYDGFGRVVRHPWLDGGVGNTSGGNRPAIIEHVHGYDAASNRLSKLDGRTGASWSDRDWEYSYDGLNRLSQADKGVRGSSSWTPAAGGQQWVLDMLGNWVTQRTDLNGNGAYTNSADLSDARTYNEANELGQVARTIGSSTTTLPLAYDDGGNMRTEQLTTTGATRRYTHDAWGRLVKVERKSSTAGSYATLATYGYNGLHWRIAKAIDVTGAGGTPDRRVNFWYDASWRIVQEDYADVWNDNPSDVANPPEYYTCQQIWGVRYIDDAIARLTDGLYFQLSDAQFSVSGVIHEAGGLVERTSYTPYGEVTRRHPADVDASGKVDSTDYDGVIDPLADAHSGAGTPITDGSYIAEADINRDGLIDASDYALCLASDNAKPEAGLVSGYDYALPGGPRNPIGYCGYVFNEETQHYIVRHRHYSPYLGRWLERDPAGYVDGSNLYEYLLSGPLDGTDPWGLCRRDDNKTWKAIMAKLGLTEDEARKFAKWLEDAKELGSRGLGSDIHSDKKLLDILYEHFWRSENPGKAVPDKIAKNAAQSRKSFDPKKLSKMLERFGLALVVYTMLSQTASVVADQNNPCNKYWNEVFNQLKSGKLDEPTLKKLAEDCQDYVSSNSNFGWDGWILSDELRLSVLNALRDAINSRRAKEEAEKCKCKAPEGDKAK